MTIFNILMCGSIVQTIFALYSSDIHSRDANENLKSQIEQFQRNLMTVHGEKCKLEDYAKGNFLLFFRFSSFVSWIDTCILLLLK